MNRREVQSEHAMRQAEGQTMPLPRAGVVRHNGFVETSEDIDEEAVDVPVDCDSGLWPGEESATRKRRDFHCG